MPVTCCIMGHVGPGQDLPFRQCQYYFYLRREKHTSPDFTIPTGAVPDKANLQLFNSYCDRIIINIKNSTVNFRMYFRTFTDGYMTNMKQAYIIQYGHVDRHLRQIRRDQIKCCFSKG